jgi:mRNA interferase MazF
MGKGLPGYFFKRRLVMRRGEIWWAELPPPIGRRPVLLLSRNEAYTVRNAVTVAEVTSIVRDIPVEVELNQEDGMPKRCIVNLDTLVTIRKALLKEKLTTLRDEKLEKVNSAIKFALSIP